MNKLPLKTLCLFWPGVVAVFFALLFLTGPLQAVYFKLIAFVYVMALPVLVYLWRAELKEK